MNSNKNQELSPEEEIQFFQGLEDVWRKSLPRYSDAQHLQIFPEAKKILPEKIREWQEGRRRVVANIRNKLTLIKNTPTDEFSRWFWREWVKVNEGYELLEIDRQSARLKRLQAAAKGKVVKGWLTEDQIQRALAVSIEEIASRYTKLRRSGKNLVGLCPLHTEKHPSFFVYPKTNSYWCYGCNQGGNVINLVGLLHSYSFKEAVKYLTGE